MVKLAGAVADVTGAEQMEDIAARTVDEFGRLDIWVNNAGVDLFGRLEEVTVAAWHRVIEVNLLGTYHGSRAAVAVFRREGRGVLVNVSSVLGGLPSPYQSAYVASKAGVRALTDSLRQELWDATDIHVVSVLPGPVDTQIFAHAGNHSGRGVQAPEPLSAPEEAAMAIIDVARKPRAEVVVGWSAKGALLARRLAPRTTEHLARGVIAEELAVDRPEPPHDGNLFIPDPEPTVSGGWRDSDRSPLRLLMSGALAGVRAPLLRRGSPTSRHARIG